MTDEAEAPRPEWAGRAYRAGETGMARAVQRGAETMGELVHQTMLAAMPIIEAGLREQIAQEIEARRAEWTKIPPTLYVDQGHVAGLSDAAAVARGVFG